MTISNETLFYILLIGSVLSIFISFLYQDKINDIMKTIHDENELYKQHIKRYDNDTE